jgi:hypothetical protein
MNNQSNISKVKNNSNSSIIFAGADDCPITNEILSNVCSFLWFNDLCKASITSKSFSSVCKTEFFHLSMFGRLLNHMGREKSNNEQKINKSKFIIKNNSNTDTKWEILSKRITVWPTGIDNAIVRNFLEPRNICICNSGDASTGISDNLCVLYKRNESGDSHKPSFAGVVADQYFPCLPKAHSIAIIKPVLKVIDNVIPSSNSSHNSISSHNSNSNSFNEFSHVYPNNSSINSVNTMKGDSIYRSSAPFTKIFRTSDDNEVAILSCIAYFEVKIHEDNTISNISNNGNNIETEAQTFLI